ncbi:MAG: hypothetical protein RL095_617 [Verrucomicrobiota bacterium]|jgi:hypothetical protein
MKIHACLLLVASLTLGSCSQISDKRHVWDEGVYTSSLALDTESWPVLRRGQLSLVACDQRALCEKMLEKESWKALTPVEVEIFCPGFRFTGVEGRKPYLIRGVAYAQEYSTCLVRQDPETKLVTVYQGTWNGEMLGFAHDICVSPLVVWLKEAPLQVKAGAAVGGDGFDGHLVRAGGVILSTSDFQKAKLP